MANPKLSMMLVGDLILDEPEPDSFFDLSREVLSPSAPTWRSLFLRTNKM